MCKYSVHVYGCPKVYDFSKSRSLMSLECVKNHEEISQNEQYYHVAAWIGVWVSEEYIVL